MIRKSQAGIDEMSSKCLQGPRLLYNTLNRNLWAKLTLIRMNFLAGYIFERGTARHL